MKTLDQLNAKLAAMPRADLEIFARNVVLSLYGDNNPDEEDFPLRLDQDKEWDGDTLGNVADDIADAGLNPDKL